MKKYKLINTKTKEEHLCDKVTIDGFDYYVSDEVETRSGKIAYINNNVYKGELRVVTTVFGNSNLEDCKKVIATNNPTIDIPQVVNKIDLTKLCYYDRRNTDFSIKEEYGYDKEEVGATGNFAKKDCACDNCFYGRSSLTEQLIKSQETHPNSDKDVVDFYEWCDTSEEAAIFWRRNKVDPDMSGNHWKKIRENREKLLQLWKEQQPKIVYYE